MTFAYFLQVLALVLLVLAAIPQVEKAANAYVNLGWAGLACWMLSLLLR